MISMLMEVIDPFQVTLTREELARVISSTKKELE